MKITVEDLYQNFLKLSKISEENMSSSEKRERRITFFAGAGSMFKLLESFGEIEDELEISKRLNDVEKELNDYWSKYLK